MSGKPKAPALQPAVVDLVTAAKMLGVGRTVAYQLVRQGQWPTPILRIGNQIRVPRAPLLALLCMSQDLQPSVPTSASAPDAVTRRER